MYGTHGRNALITTENAVSVLSFACFLELKDLADFCSDILLTRMSASTIHSMIMEIDRLATGHVITAYGPYGGDHAYHTLLALHHDNLEKCCLSYLLQLTCAIGFESNTKYSESQQNQIVPWSQWKHADCLLASLSNSWIRKIIGYHTICIESEFARYSTIKKIYEYKEKSMIIKTEADLEHMNQSEPLQVDIEKSDKGSYLANILDSVLPTHKKRKRTDSFDLRANNELEYERSVLLKNNVHYIHLSFAELVSCRNDQIVNDDIILRSFWEQAEILHGVTTPGKRMPEFRFSVRFLDTGNLLDDNKPDKTFSSDPITCAGAQYRVILCRSNNQNTPENIEDCIVIEDERTQANASRNSTTKSKSVVKALLQRTRSSSSSQKGNFDISYKLYCFDRNAFIKGNIQDAAFFEPFTVCNFDGSGVAKHLPSSMLQMDDSHKKKEKLGCDFWVSVLIQFNFK